MSITVTLYDILVAIVVIGMGVLLFEVFNKIIFPWIVEKRTKDIEKNPKWIMQELQEKYYGFNDMDIITVESPLGMLPRFRVNKQSPNRLQLLISTDTSTREIDIIAQLALAGKLKAKYGVWYPDKPIQWLSILNFMLDGGDIRVETVSTSKDKDKKPIDLM